MSAHEIIGNDALKPGAHWAPGATADLLTMTRSQYDHAIAEAKVEALREAAEVLPCATEGPDRIGTARWKQPARNGYSIAIEEAQIALRHRADEIEAGR